MGPRRAWWRLAGLAAAALLALAGCGGGDEEGRVAAPVTITGETDEHGDPVPERGRVTLQLKWVTQAQFAGYYAAKAKGFYDEVRLEVTIKPGGPDITPEQVVASGQAEFGIDWLPALLAARDEGGDLVNIGQVFQRSGMLELAHRDSGIRTVADLRGKRVGVWCCGNENELYCRARQERDRTQGQNDVTIVNQPFDVNLFLEKQIDAAAAMTYNELAQVLETENPDTGELYTLDDLNVISMEDAGTAMLERTAEIARRFGVIRRAPSQDAYRDDLAILAVTEPDHDDVEVKGAGWEKADVEVTPDGD